MWDIYTEMEMATPVFWLSVAQDLGLLIYALPFHSTYHISLNVNLNMLAYDMPNYSLMCAQAWTAVHYLVPVMIEPYFNFLMEYIVCG